MNKAVEAFKNSASKYKKGLQMEGKILPGLDPSFLPLVGGIND